MMPLYDSDPLMSRMHIHILGDSRVSYEEEQERRRERIEFILHAMKAQGLVPECTLIDEPLQRLAFDALLEPLFVAHEARFFTVFGFARKDSAGAAEVTFYFRSLTRHLACHGFTREASARFRFRKHVDWDLSMDARPPRRAFAGTPWFLRMPVLHRKYASRVDLGKRPRY